MYFNALGNIGSAAVEAVPTLIEFLNDKDLGSLAAQTLGKIGPAAIEAVPALIDMLGKVDVSDWHDAYNALRSITSKDFGFQVEPWQDWWKLNKP